MKFKYTILASCTVFLFAVNSLFAQVLLPSTKDSRQVISLNGTWKFKFLPSMQTGQDSLFYETGFDVSKWATIKTPGNWELQGFAEPVYHKRVKPATGLYRTTFTVPENWKKNPVYISFDGVHFGYSFWINGKYVGEFASAFNRQVFDVSSFVTAGKTHTLAVKVITQPRGWEFDTHDDWSLSGITRDVTLFSLSPVHIKDVVIKTFVNSGNADVDITGTVEKTWTDKFPSGLKFTGQLLDANGKLVKEISLVSNQSTGDVLEFKQRVTVEKANLWSAENPYLYTLRLFLADNAVPLQQFTDKVGIRQVTWTGAVLKLNGSPIKLKGATHHDLSPVHGRCITEAEMLQDLLLMQKANINFVRTSHYPPNTRLLELCDSLGLYVMDEVPYGFGEEHLKDSSYLPILLLRAKATIARDKNRACVIAWSVGNENPVTEIGLKTGALVKALDNTRPYCFPQGPGDFREMLKEFPKESAPDLLAPHYLRANELLEYAGKIDRPLIMTEYAHALGLDFGSMEAIYEVMAAHPEFAGGAVWEFFDQGILRKASKPISKGEKTFFAWATADSMYNTSTNEGTDGVVYANRVPQTDYWQLRKVYTPVKALDDTLQYKAGKQSFKINIINRYDFTNLSAIKCKWQLFADTALISSGIFPLNCKPHDTVAAVIHTTLPEKPTARYYYIRLSFENSKHITVYEKTYLIKKNENRSLLNNIVSGKPVTPVKEGNTISAANYRFEFKNESGTVQLQNKNGDVLIAEGPFARVGRKSSIALDATTTSRRSKTKHTLWNPFILSNPETKINQFDAHQLIVNYKYKPDSLEQRSVAGDIAYRFSDSGYINIHYRLVPDGKEHAVDAGLLFVIPSTYTEFRWIGKGPYAAYPGKDRLSEFGIYHLNSNDLYFAGNRQYVDCAVFTNSKGDGFALIANAANITVERTAAGIVVSHNMHVSQTFNKYEWPTDLFAFETGKAIEGNFSIVPFTAATMPVVLQQLFGKSKKIVKAFQPFYHSYDQ